MSKSRRWIFFLAIFMVIAVAAIIVLTLLGPALAPTYEFVVPR